MKMGTTGMSKPNWRLVNDLIKQWNLNTCEASDLSHTMEVLSKLYNNAGLIRSHVKIRAELLHMCGSEVQGLWDRMYRGKDKV